MEMDQASLLQLVSTNLAKPLDSIRSNLFWLNSNEIGYVSEVHPNIMALQLFSDKKSGVWLYNIISNQWRIYMEYPDDVPSIYCPQVNYNRRTKHYGFMVI